MKFDKLKFKRKRNINHHGNDDQNIVFETEILIKKRMRVIGFVIVSLMFILIVRLYQLQIVSQNDYQKKLASYTSRYRKITTPRGEMLDRNLNLLVTNRQVIDIVYYPAKDATSSIEWELAERFVNTFSMDDVSLTQRDLKDLFIYLFPSVASDKITDDDWNDYHSGILSDNDIYYLKLDRITDVDISTLTENQRNIWSVYGLMKTANISQFAVIKSDVTFEEASYFLEHNEDFRGFDITIDWQREYIYQYTLRNLFGSITTSKSGLPSERLNYYLALDYSRNEKVGRSGLELQYEDLLSGERSLYNLTYNQEGLAVLDEINSGSRGYDLRLSIDIDLQTKVEDILIANFEAQKDNIYRKYWDTAYVVVTKPDTGDVLAIVGMKKDGTIYYNDPVSTYTESVIVGSAVKGATVYMGLDTNVISAGEYIIDQPIKIKDTPLKSSHKNLGRINDIQALSMSSNVYMFNIAMRLGNANYQYDQALNIDISAFDTMRNYFSQFGLGVKTGIDVPNEGVGYLGNSSLPGHLLDYAIGQFSTYTPIQMAQYVSTIANGGYLIQPRILLEAYYPQTNIIAYQNHVTILSTLDNTEALSRVQKGLKACVTDGLCKAYLSNLQVSVAAKTGTAENTLAEDSSISSPNSTLIAYAPADEPQIAIACAAVNAWNDKTQSNICQKIAAEIIDAYFD
ncbi:MAG: penicillin-binding protein 2 [Erysipelotrichaceae bacterium]|nr:penicillin-binding protein 2 [Erysipelotrichaceae bacterium]MDD3923505.1 penicillin-binding protein 2 [Erysipelotrichaceae bacterium]MDD4642541.1 penicillin-binding protein 2 [Erysipelotrichaceae bacterium]